MEYAESDLHVDAHLAADIVHPVEGGLQTYPELSPTENAPITESVPSDESAGLTVNSAEDAPAVQASAPEDDDTAQSLEEKVEAMQEQIADDDATSTEAETASVDGPLDLADLQSKRLGYAAEGLGLDGLIDVEEIEE